MKTTFTTSVGSQPAAYSQHGPADGRAPRPAVPILLAFGLPLGIGRCIVPDTSSNN